MVISVYSSIKNCAPFCRSFKVGVCFSKPSPPSVDGDVKFAFNLTEMTSPSGGRKLKANLLTKKLVEGTLVLRKGKLVQCLEELKLDLVDQIPSYEDVGLKLTFEQIPLEDNDGRLGASDDTRELDVIVDAESFETSLKVPFKTECSGPDKKCINDLMISISGLEGKTPTLVVGQRKTIPFKIIVKNAGPDPAYQVDDLEFLRPVTDAGSYSIVLNAFLQLLLF